MTARILLGLSLTLLLTACGGPTAAGDGLPDGVDPNDPRAGRMVMDHMMDSVVTTELGDDELAALLETHRRVRAAGDDVRRAMAAVAGSGKSYGRYGKAMFKWQMMQEAARKGAEGVQRELDDMDQQRGRLEAELEEAPPAQQLRLRRDLERYTLAEGVMRKGLESLKKLATPEIQALVREWKPRFDAVDAEFD